MRKVTKRSSLLFLLLFLPAVLHAQQSRQWVHVRIDNPVEGEKVRINIPVGLVETMLPLIEQKQVEKGKMRWNDSDISVEQLRRAWNELRKYKDTEFMSIQNRDTNVRVFMQGNYLLVQPEKTSRKKVDIKIPLQVVDALLSGRGEELNLAGAVNALKDLGTREIITIESEESFVRVWIDENNQSK